MYSHVLTCGVLADIADILWFLDAQDCVCSRTIEEIDTISEKLTRMIDEIHGV